MTNRMNATAIRVGEVPSSNLGAPIAFISREVRTVQLLRDGSEGSSARAPRRRQPRSAATVPATSIARRPELQYVMQVLEVTS